MEHIESISAQEALNRLKEGNKEYIAKGRHGSFSHKKREQTAKSGQHPYAVIVCCADSRAIPEVIFCCGIGELFVVRVAGNVAGKTQLASIEYAVGHLGCNLVVVLGHTDCGAVAATYNGVEGEYLNTILGKIKKAIGNEKDIAKCVSLNTLNSVKAIESAFPKITCLPALYDVATGKVTFDVEI